ncbi:MAG: hypothetical protein SAJ37_19435 [Oscillatoria sp. PMC 1068.18]|nr:hypothetical protein [Oscillatoria sp. PMC 1076.18]MEC4990911.1 hypothetical protein [Oscillatoria sp. PMC 1068.18]
MHQSTYKSLSILLLTGILSAGTVLTLPDLAAGFVSSRQLGEYLAENSLGSELPRLIGSRVLTQAIEDLNVPLEQLDIIYAEKRTWRNGCLGLGKPDDLCTQALVEGWQVTVKNGERKFIYRTNEDGTNVRLETANTSVSNLPRSVEQAVLANAARQWNVSSSSLRILAAEKEIWSDSCLGLGQANESCLQALVAGWRVTVTNGTETLVYRTNDDGSNIRLETANTPVSNAPRRVINAVLEDAAEKLEVPTSYFRVISAEKRTWGDRCLGIPDPLALCAQAIVEGWLVKVDVGDQIWVYRTDERGDLVKVENPYAAEDTFSIALAEAVLRQASQKSGLPMSQLRIVESSRQTWDGCYGIYIDRRACPEIGIPGWRVIIESENGQKLVYHTDLKGSEIRFNPVDSELGLVNEVKPVRIPTSELPESLPRNVIFRAVSSGGFAGRTSETILYTNGRLVRNQLGGNGTILSTESEIVSRQQIREFQRLLQQQNFAQFNRLSYPAPRGAADFITVTLISRESVTSYVDFNQDRLPLALQNIVKSWNQLSSGI